MRVDHAMILNVVNQPGDAVVAMRALVEDNHEDERGREKLSEQARALGDELVDAGVLEWLPEPDADGRVLRLAIELQEDFALNQPLASFALVALELLDPESEDHALDVISVVEAILDDPFPVLMAQANKARGEAVAEMKAEGIEYDERMELLEEVTYPKPLAEPLQDAFRVYRETLPWVRESDLSPKVGRARHVRAGADVHRVRRALRPARSEGLVLRYLSARTGAAPDGARAGQDGRADEIVEWLGETVRPDRLEPARRVEALTDPESVERAAAAAAAGSRRRPRGRSPANGARSRSWSATRCS
jgi:hypothetical protein